MAIIKSLDILLRAPTGALTRDLKNGSKQLQAFGSKVRGIFSAAFGALSVAAFVGGIKKSLSVVDNLAKTADKLGIVTVELQKLRLAASLSSEVTGEQFDNALQRMIRNLSEAANGTGAAVKVLDELGLSADNLSKMTPDKQFLAIADAMAAVDNQGDRVRLTFALFGRQGVNLVNTLKQGSKAIQQAGSDIDNFGIGISRLDAAKAEAANDAFTKLYLIAGGVFTRITINLTPALKELFDVTTGLFKPTSIFNGLLEGMALAAFTLLRIFNHLISALNLLSSLFGVAAGKVMGYAIAMFFVVRITKQLIALYALLQVKAKALLIVEILRASLTGKNAAATALALGVGAATIATALIALNQFEKKMGDAAAQGGKMNDEFDDMADASLAIAKQRANLSSASVNSQAAFETIFGVQMDAPIDRLGKKVDKTNDILAQMRDGMSKASTLDFDTDEVTF